MYVSDWSNSRFKSGRPDCANPLWCSLSRGEAVSGYRRTVVRRYSGQEALDRLDDTIAVLQAREDQLKAHQRR